MSAESPKKRPAADFLTSDGGYVQKSYDPLPGHRYEGP